MLLHIPTYSLTLRGQFRENNKKFHKLYTVTISFSNEYYSIEQTNSIMSEWFNHHKAAFNEYWIHPELCPTSRRVHYHGLIDVKDQFRLNNMLRLFKPVGSFHIETIKSNLNAYLDYCTKETGITEACEYQYNRFIKNISLGETPKGALKQEQH